MNVPTRCECGAWMVAGLRHEATQTVDVALCLACWREEPAYLSRPAPLAPPRPLDTRRCATCRGSMAGRNLDSVYCSLACRRSAGRVALVCAACGTAFTRPLSWAERRPTPYCSRACIDWQGRLAAQRRRAELEAAS